MTTDNQVQLLKLLTKRFDRTAPLPDCSLPPVTPISSEAVTYL